MTWLEFEQLLFSPKFALFSCVFLFFLIILYVFYKKQIYSLFDPLNIMILNFSSVFTIFFILFYLNKIDNQKLFQLILINVFLLLSFKFFLKEKKYEQKEKEKKYKIFYLFYKIHSILFILLVILYFYFIGLNALYSRLTVYNNLGVLNYLNTIIFPGQLVLILLKRWMYLRRDKRDVLSIGIILILFMISGGKTATISFVLYFYSVSYFLYITGTSQNFIRYKKIEKIIFIVAFLGVMFLFSLSYNLNSIMIVFQKIFFRILSTGDIYYMVYPFDLIDKLEGLSIREYFLDSIFLPVLRRFNYQNKTMGYEVIENLYGISNPTFGPNTRADIILQMNLGYFGIIFALILGYFLAKLRKIKTTNFFRLYLAIILMISSESIITDFSLFAMRIFTIVFIIIPLYLFCEFINILLDKKGVKNE